MQKLVRDLKPGDILPAGGGLQAPSHSHICVARRVVIATYVYEGTPSMVSVTLVECGKETGLTYGSWHQDAKVDVEPHAALTPAQQHADELLDLVRTITTIPGPWNERKHELLDKIEPSVPPTLEELAAMLLKARTQLAGYTRFGVGDIDALLARVPKK